MFSLPHSGRVGSRCFEKPLLISGCSRSVRGQFSFFYTDKDRDCQRKRGEKYNSAEQEYPYCSYPYALTGSSSSKG